MHFVDVLLGLFATLDDLFYDAKGAIDGEDQVVLRAAFGILARDRQIRIGQIHVHADPKEAAVARHALCRAHRHFTTSDRHKALFQGSNAPSHEILDCGRTVYIIV